MRYMEKSPQLILRICRQQGKGVAHVNVNISAITE